MNIISCISQKPATFIIGIVSNTEGFVIIRVSCSSDLAHASLLSQEFSFG